MISATSLSSASSPHSLTKSAQIPLGLENGRLRVDSQKFLVPSLPVSARALNTNNDPSNKRRERSIVNGVAHHPDPHGLSGLRRSYSASPLHQPQLHSPRKDAQSPLYSGEGCGGIPSNPSNFSSVRSSVPIPCSSPSPASSASPNKSHSPSSLPSSSANGSYTPQMTPGLPDLNSAAAAAARLYPTSFHGLAPGHLSPYYAAAAAAAAASHSLPYPIFGAHSYNTHSASSYLDNFHHSNLLVPQMRTSPSASPPRPPSSYIPPSPPQHSPQQHQGPHSTSTTSLHHQLIESVGAGERYNGHIHNHLNNHPHNPHSHHNGLPHNPHNSNGRYTNSGPAPLTKVSPSGAVCNGLSNPSPPGPHPTKFHGGMESSNEKTFGRGPKNWADNFSPHKISAETEEFKGKDGSLKHYILTRSPEDLTVGGSGKVRSLQLPLNERGSPSSAHESSAMCNLNNPFLPPSPKKRSGQWNFVTNVSNDLPSPHSMAMVTDDLKYLSNQTTKNPSSNNALTSNNSCNIIHSPKSPYLITPPSSTAQNFHFQFPNLKSTTTNNSSSSNNNNNNNNNSSPSSSASNGSNSNSPKNSGNHSPATSILSSPSTPTVFSYPTKSKNSKIPPTLPIPIEQLPTIEAFHRGSLTQLPNGDLKRVEDLTFQDFFTAAEFLSDSISIINCTVISIHLDTNSSLCKVILTMGSHNQQVIVETTAEQPFYVIGRGWSSSAPTRTEQRLQLRCTPLSVGDVCITLRRNASPVMVTNSAPPNKNPKSNSKGTPNNSPKSKLSGGAPPKGATSRVSTNPVKPGRRVTTNAITSNKAATTSNGNAMLPPPTPPPNHVASNHPSKSGAPMGKRASPPLSDENNHPSCPKKRRWSAPEAISDDNDNPAVKPMVYNSINIIYNQK